MPLGDGLFRVLIELLVARGGEEVDAAGVGLDEDREELAIQALGLTPGIGERVVARSARLLTSGLASSPAGARPAQIVAVDPAA